MRFGKGSRESYIVTNDVENKTQDCDISKNNNSNNNQIEEMIHVASVNAMFWTEVKYNLRRFLAYGIGNLLLLMLGSLLFFYVEHCLETKVPKALNIGEKSFIEICSHHQKLLLEKHQRNISSLPASLNTTSLFIDQIELLCRVNEALVLDKRTCHLTVLEWYKWMEYTFSVAFTLGYGRMVTRSKLGKLLTIIYAIPTITLSTITYVYCGNMVKNAVKVLVVTFEVKILKRQQVHRLTLKTVFLQLLLCITLILLFSLFFNVADSMALSYLDSFYFVMVTLLTIGFGDIVIDLEKLVHYPHIFLLGNVIFIFGLGTLASLITSLCDLRIMEVPVTGFLKKTTKKIGPKVTLSKISKQGTAIATIERNA